MANLLVHYITMLFLLFIESETLQWNPHWWPLIISFTNVINRATHCSANSFLFQIHTLRLWLCDCTVPLPAWSSSAGIKLITWRLITSQFLNEKLTSSKPCCRTIGLKVTVKMEAARSSETLVFNHNTTRRNNTKLRILSLLPWKPQISHQAL
jgi:hypothetical protein